MQKRVLTVLILGTLVSFCAFGDSTQWVIAPSGGSYSYAGGAAPLVGTNIGIENVEGVGTPLHSGTLGTLDIVGGSLDFTSGANTGGWSWGTPGTLTITGCIAGVTTVDLVCTVADESAVLVSDEFTSVSVTGVPGGLGFEFGSLQGTINADIAANFGMDPVFTSPGSTATDVVSGLPTTGVPFFLPATGSSFSGVTPSAPGGTLNLVSAVPEGWSFISSLGLLAFGLAVFGVARRRGVVKSVEF
jgi:hypothetical protein